MCHCQFNWAFAIWSLLNIITNRFRLRCSINISDALPTAALTTASDIVIVSKLIRRCLRLKLSNTYPVNFLQFTFIHIVSEIWSVCIYESKWLLSYSKFSMNFDLNVQILRSMNQIIRLISNQTSNYSWCFLLIPNKLFFYFGLFRITTVFHAMGSS